MMIVDSHQHVFWHGRDDAGLVADMDAHGIALAWLLTWEIPPWPAYEDNFVYNALLNPAHVRPDGSHAGIPLSDLLIAKRRYPDRFVLGYCPDPALPDAPALFEAACRVHGVRVCGEWKFRMPIDDPRCLELFRAAGRMNAPVVLHLDVPYRPDPATGMPVYQPRWYGGTVDNLERALRSCPETTFIGHAPGFWREISGDAGARPEEYPAGPVTPGGRLYRLFDTYPNLFADLSAGSALAALRRDEAHARAFLTRYADRLLFGRDYYGGDLLAFLSSLHLPADVIGRIQHGNAERLLAR
jgi:predicted TIM-barrel fold metal-dependent hydrolase